MRAGILALLALTLVVSAGPGQAAPTKQLLLDWTEGSFEAGMAGAGKHLFPSDELAPDHERLSFQVDPCHRQLSLGLEYEPRNLSARVTHDGNAAEVTRDYNLQAGLIAPNGTVLHRIQPERPDKSIAFGTVEEAGEYTLELELLEGAMVDWRVRMRGFQPLEEPTCDLWVNEVEANPAGPDPGNEWVEVYNGADVALDLSGWQLRAPVANTSHEIPEGTEIAAGGFEQVVLAEDAFSSQALANEDETVQLLAPVGGVLDASEPLSDEADDDRTYQKSPDGTGEWIFAQGTPGEPNDG